MSVDYVTIAQLIDNLKNEEVSERLKSIKSLDKIAQALGQRRSAQELMPFLQDCCDDEDSVLLALIEQLQNISPLVGSETPIIPVMKNLIVSDSKIVRDRAIQAILTFKDVQNILPLTEELLSSEWYNYRTSGLQLVQFYLQNVKVNEKRQKLFNLIKTDAQDPLPMVRRSVAENLLNFVSELNFDEIQQFAKNLLKQLSDDPQDAVRAVAVKSYPAFLLRLSQLTVQQPSQANELNASRKELYGRFLQTHCAEVSWRVRYVCADCFSSVLEAYLGYDTLSPVYTLPRESVDARACDEIIDPFIGNAVVLPAKQETTNYNVVIYNNKPKLPQGPDFDELKSCQIFAKLLQDAEPETRCIAVQRLIRVCNALPATKQFSAQILPVLSDRAANDDSVFVRVTLARTVCYLAPLLEKDVVQKQISQIVVKILADKDANVKVALLRNLAPVTTIIGLTQFSEQILNTILVLANDSDWRVRVQVVESLVGISKLMDADTFSQKLKNLIVEYLKDPVNYVRRSAATSFVEIGHGYGNDFVKKVVIVQLQEMARQQNYLQRNNALFMCQQLIQMIGQAIGGDVTQVILQLLDDQVPNIRFMACQVSGNICKLIGDSNKQLLQQKVQACLNDQDKDVQQFAQATLKLMK